MSKKTFDFYRSTNNRLHVALDHNDNYQRYLKRIQKIVDKKPHLDKSPAKYMTFMNRVKQISRHHTSQQRLNFISQNNQILLNKILQVKNRQTEVKMEPDYSLAMHEKREREVKKINKQNQQFALRVINQPSQLKQKQNLSFDIESPKRRTQKMFYESRIKQRKLPKLLNSKVV